MDVIICEKAYPLYYLSWVGMPTGIIGIIYQKPILGSCVCIGSLLAQNYWRNPTYGFRRNIDIIWIQFLIWLHLWYIWNTHIRTIYCAIQLSGVFCYCYSWHQQKYKNIEKAIFYHGLVHICANVSLLIFYLH